jgi:hypothetical protein
MSSISHQQAVAEHWGLPNTEIFQTKDVCTLGLDILYSVYGFGSTPLNDTVWIAMFPEAVANGVLRLYGVEEGGAEVVDGIHAGGPTRLLLHNKYQSCGSKTGK